MASQKTAQGAELNSLTKILSILEKRENWFKEWAVSLTDKRSEGSWGFADW